MLTDTKLPTPQWQTRMRDDDQRIREVVPELCKRLYEQRFGKELYWDRGDTVALNRILATNKNWTVSDVEDMVKSYYASDGIPYLQQPYEWLPLLFKYRDGPLDHQGTSKRQLAAINAEVGRMNRELLAEEDRRKQERDTQNKEAQLDRAIARVHGDLLSKGYEVFKPAGPASCHLIAMSRVLTRRAQALRILVRPYGVAPTNDTRYYEAIVPREAQRNPLNSSGPMLSHRHDPDVVTYQPPLED